MTTFATAWDVVREALLVGWLVTAVFCALAAAAIASWGGRGRGWAFLAGLLGLYLGVLVVLVVAAGRASQRRREVLPVVPTPPVGPPAPVPPAGIRAGATRAWQRWCRVPPSRAELVVAGLALLLAAGWTATIGLTWLQVTVVDRGVYSLGPFEIQLGAFVVLTALALLAVAVGVVRGRSAWWPVLLAWFALWWVFVVVEARRAGGGLDELGGLLRDVVRDRTGYDVRPGLALGAAWPVVGVLTAATLLLAVALLVLHARQPSQYRLLARP